MEKEHLDFVENRIRIAVNGGNIESNKWDFKLKWYDLKDDKEVNEFLKDITAIVNSYGGGDGYIIFGFKWSQEDGYKFDDAKMTDCGFSDDRYIYDKILGAVDKAFNIQVVDHSIEIEGKERDISILHIPPSSAKPHVIKKYIDKKGREFENEIFVRRLSTNRRATKEDIDMMYIERPTIQVDYKAELNMDKSLTFLPIKNYGISCSLGMFQITNLGTRTISYGKLRLWFRFIDDNILGNRRIEFTGTFGNLYSTKPNDITNVGGISLGSNEKPDLIPKLHKAKYEIMGAICLTNGREIPIMVNVTSLR